MSKPEPWTEEEVNTVMFNFANVVVPVMTAEHAKEDGRSGAVLDMRNPLETLIFMRAGTAPEDKFLGYEENAKAKNDALEENPKLLTSWEVHRGDVSHKPYPGSIRTPFDDRFSISGFTWQRDTIGGLYLAHQAGCIGLADAGSRAAICGIRTQFIMLTKKLNRAQRELAEAA